MKRGGRSTRLWQSVEIDKHLTLGLKAVVLMYIMVAPSAWRDVSVDLMPVYAVGFVLGTLTLSVDLTLGGLVLAAVTITMVSINRRNASAAPAPDAPAPLDTTHTAPAMAPAMREDFSPVPAQGDSDAAIFEIETSVGEKAPPEDTAVGPDFLLRPDGVFVTEANLSAAQTNIIGPDDVYSPLGPSAYSVQGRARDVPVVPMVW